MSKAAIVLLLDIGFSMTKDTEALRTCLKTATLLIQNEVTCLPSLPYCLDSLLIMQILYGSKQTEMALLLFGSSSTQNHLQDDGYKHISVLSEFLKPSVDMLKMIDNITPSIGGSNADCTLLIINVSL